MTVAAWQHTLDARVRDAINVYYARYSDATPGEIEAWLRDRGFDVSLGDVEDYMAALDSRPDWRSGWINRNIGRYSGAFDPDQFLATRSYGESRAGQVAEDESEEELEEGEEEYEDEELKEGEEEEYEDEQPEEGELFKGDEYGGEALAPAAPVPTLGGEDRLPGIALAVLGLAVSAGIIALAIFVLR
jgi:hypothetical protein